MPGRGTATGGRKGAGRAIAAAILLSVSPLAAQTSKRVQALHFYEQAVELRKTLEQGEPSAKDFVNAIGVFRKVYVTSPASSRADDSLAAVAELYAEMAKRFGDEPARRKAAETYEFLIREYPESPLVKQAREKLEPLNAPAPAVVPDAASPVTAPAAPLPQVTEVRFWSSPGLTRIVVDLQAESAPRGDRLRDPDRVYFDLPQTRMGPALKGKTYEVGDALAKRIRVAQTQAATTRVVVDLNAEALDYSLATLTNPPRVVLELRERGAKPAPRTAEAKPAPPAAVAVAKIEAVPPPVEPKPPVVAKAPAAKPPAAPVAVTPAPPAPPARAPDPVATAKAAAANSRGERTLTRALGLKIARVVIDAGHGGHDTGTIGPTGLTEKDLTLDLARRVGELVSERLGSEVVQTREEDIFVALQDRTALANEKQADLFLSIHANSSRVKSVRGVETYYLNFTADTEALEVAARENATSEKSVHDLQDLVKKITLTDKVTESREFALQVHRALHRGASKDSPALRNRGVRKAPFVVLIGAQMPSVLAEVTFLSNPRDEKLLKGPEARQRLAEALYEGVAAYAGNLSRVEVASK